MKGKFTFRDLYDQFESIMKLGPLNKVRHRRWDGVETNHARPRPPSNSTSLSLLDDDHTYHRPHVTR